ncbi:MAG TPA: ABC transporter ATP-binding protein [Epulopiscium sp.]|nr:ABC transporter ATP-binding protein [Candidatus Epulonipiscium sp.]
MGENISIKNLSFSYDKKVILDDINLEFNKGNFYSIIGPNGSGKSTLIKNISKTLASKGISVFIGDKDIRTLNNKTLAKVMAIIPQTTIIDYEFTVSEIVMMGRSPHKKRFEDFNRSDERIIKKYMKATSTWELKDKLITELSGGEAQRVIAARVLCQETDIVLLDEPTSSLDIQYQIEFLNIFRNLKTDKIIIAVLHDLNLASVFSDEIILINKGQVVAKGTPWDVINEENIKNVYNISVKVFENPISKCPHIIPIV